MEELAHETELPKGVTKDHFLGSLASGAILLSLMVLVVGLVEGAFFSLAPPRGALECAVDFKLVTPLMA